MAVLRDWNMLVTVRESRYQEARQRLCELGEVGETGFFNVLVLRVDDIHQTLERLRAWFETEPQIRGWLGHAVPVTTTFSFASPAEFEAQARAAVMDWLQELAGKSFHVRMRRRGFKGRLSSQEEERRLGNVIVEALAEAGTSARVAFDDPDVIIFVETVGQQAGLSIWTREMLARYPFLHPD